MSSSQPLVPPDLNESPLYLLAVLHSARKSKDRALESITRRRLVALGVEIIFGDELPIPPSREGIGRD